MRRIRTYRAGQTRPASPPIGQAFVHYDGNVHVWDLTGGTAREAAELEADPDAPAEFVGKAIEGSGREYWITDD